MRQHVLLNAPSTRAPSRSAALIGVLSVAALTGCASGELRGDASTGWLPPAVTEVARSSPSLWIGAWIAALAVGALVWGLIGWCVVAYRRRKDDNELPVQLRYNIPIEILYTVVPIFMVVVLFYYTARDESTLLDTSQEPDVTVNVVGKQWSWDFNYVEDDVHEVGTQAILTGEPGAPETVPTLYLPVGERVEFVLTARDVIHSFWVPAFLQKMDMIPGRVNRLPGGADPGGHLQGQVRRAVRDLPLAHALQRQGRPSGRVRPAHADLRAAGQTGLLNNTLNRDARAHERPGRRHIDGGN